MGVSGPPAGVLDAGVRGEGSTQNRSECVPSRTSINVSDRPSLLHFRIGIKAGVKALYQSRPIRRRQLKRLGFE